jgi:very-short-patch-repair endonuclease
MKAQTHRPIIDNALQRELRSRMTDAENRLWRRLRGRQVEGFKFRRQHPFLDFILDFACLEGRLIVEVDGGQHLDSAADRLRDLRLQEAGFRVLRFWNNQVLQETEAVVEIIRMALLERAESGPIPLTPSPSRPPP